MTTLGSNFQTEGLAIHRAPYFDGTNYRQWKIRMEMFMTAENYDLWEIVESGPYIPTKEVDKIDTKKNKSEYTDFDKKKLAQNANAKAKHMIFCALSPGEFDRVSQCASAQEIWNLLEITHEGTNQVKEDKKSMLTHQYEIFKMKPNETITEMHTRFIHIINSLKSLEKTYSNGDMVRKLLRSLPVSWKPKVTAIQEAKDLKTLPLEELIV